MSLTTIIDCATEYANPVSTFNSPAFPVKAYRFAISRGVAIINKVNNEYDAIIIGIYYSVFENKKYVDHEQLIKWSEKNSKKPIFAFWDFAVGKERAIGGLVLTGAGQGKAAAEIALQLLNDPKKLPNSIYPLFLQEGKFIFSKAEVKAKNINLPKEILDETTFVD